MKINLIVSKQNEQSNSEIDANIIRFMFKKLKYNIDVNLISGTNFKCDNASINIFFGAINPVLTQYAKTNILLFDAQCFPKSHSNNLSLMDYVFTKTTMEVDIVSNSFSKDKIINLGWRSSDLSRSASEKNYKHFMLFCLDRNTEYKKIVDSWLNINANNSECKLYIINFSLTGLNLEEYSKFQNIEITKHISQNEFEILFNCCGIHLCLPQYEGYSHYLNQIMLCKNIPVISNIASLNEMVDTDNTNFSFGVDGTSSKNKKHLSKKFIFSQESLEKVFKSINKLKDENLEELAISARSSALKMHLRNDSIFKDIFHTIIKETHSSPKKTHTKIDVDELPTVSIVTLTHNRKKFFNLAIYNYNLINYPKNKLEWIIYDTSNHDNCVEALLPPLETRESKYNIHYMYNKITETIGSSRNKALEKCKNDIIVFMDDDDYYPADSVQNRVNELVNNDNISIVGCRFVGTFEINKFISYIDSPDLFKPYFSSLKIASIAFKRAILDKLGKHNFCEDSSINELNQTLSNNFRYFKEINWENNIISLVHTKNTTYRRVPDSDSNGCHFGFGSKLFKFITELDKTDEELKSYQERLEQSKKDNQNNI